MSNMTTTIMDIKRFEKEMSNIHNNPPTKPQL